MFKGQSTFRENRRTRAAAVLDSGLPGSRVGHRMRRQSGPIGHPRSRGSSTLPYPCASNGRRSRSHPVPGLSTATSPSPSPSPEPEHGLGPGRLCVTVRSSIARPLVRHCGCRKATARDGHCLAFLSGIAGEDDLDKSCDRDDGCSPTGGRHGRVQGHHPPKRSTDRNRAAPVVRPPSAALRATAQWVFAPCSRPTRFNRTEWIRDCLA
jgi:hypothetical protein